MNTNTNESLNHSRSRNRVKNEDTRSTSFDRSIWSNPTFRPDLTSNPLLSLRQRRESKRDTMERKRRKKSYYTKIRLNVKPLSLREAFTFCFFFVNPLTRLESTTFLNLELTNINHGYTVYQ